MKDGGLNISKLELVVSISWCRLNSVHNKTSIRTPVLLKDQLKVFHFLPVTVRSFCPRWCTRMRCNA